MTENNRSVEEIKAFWSGRADLGAAAGTRDIILKRLEIDAISAYVADDMKILDIGCGNGITAIELARRYRVQVTGIDFAEPMITAAVSLAANEHLKGAVKFRLGNVRDLPGALGEFDMVYTERTLINLHDWQAQSKAIADISSLLAEGGLYVMCESSQDGLDRINSLRKQLGLATITSPWHNRYLRDAEVENLSVPGVKLETVVDFSSTYYFLSRLVNACLAAQEGREPDYESPINQLALKLPGFGDMGQTKIWLWRKVKESDMAGASRR